MTAHRAPRIHHAARRRRRRGRWRRERSSEECEESVSGRQATSSVGCPSSAVCTKLGWLEGRNIQSMPVGGRTHMTVRRKSRSNRRADLDLIVTIGDRRSRSKASDLQGSDCFRWWQRPSRNGLVVSLARPGGNATGCRLQLDLVRQASGMLREVVPSCGDWPYWQNWVADTDC